MLLQTLRVQVEAPVREVGGAGHWGQECARVLVQRLDSGPCVFVGTTA